MSIVIYFLEKINYNEISDFNRSEYKRNFLFISISYLCRSLYLDIDSKNIKSILLDIINKIRYNWFVLSDINKACISIYKELNYNESKYTDLSLSDLDNTEHFIRNKFDTLDSNYIDKIFTR